MRPARRFPPPCCDSSPTFHSAAVIELLESLAPRRGDLRQRGPHGAAARGAAAGRARGLHQCAPAPAAQGVSLALDALIDEHWIAYPEFIAGALSLLERFKLKLARRPTVRYLDVILSRADPAQRAAILARAGCEAGTFVLVVPGGGTGHPGADDAADRFEAAARALAAAGTSTVYVGPRGLARTPRAPANWHPMGSLPQADLVELMRAARLVIANGGSTLLQAIACGNACIAVPIAKDQAERIRRCVDAGVALAATLDAAAMVRCANRLLQHEDERAALERPRGSARTRRWGRGRLAGAGWSAAAGATRLRECDRHAKRSVVGLRPGAAVIPAPHAHPGRSARGGRLAGAAGALSERPLRAAHLGAARAPAQGRCGGAAPNQIERPRGALVRRLQPAAGVRRRRCHLRAQAAAARRRAGRIGVAQEEVRGDLPLGRCGCRRQRRAGGRRASRGAQAWPYCRHRSTPPLISRPRPVRPMRRPSYGSAARRIWFIWR